MCMAPKLGGGQMILAKRRSKYEAAGVRGGRGTRAKTRNEGTSLPHLFHRSICSAATTSLVHATHDENFLKSQHISMHQSCHPRRAGCCYRRAAAG